MKLLKTLVDTSVWIDHLHNPQKQLIEILDSPELLVLHPFVRGELSLSNSKKSKQLLSELRWFPDLNTATQTEVLEYIEKFGLAGTGLGWVDCHLFTSCKLEKIKLLTNDKALQKFADLHL